MAYSLDSTRLTSQALQPVNLAAIDHELSRFWHNVTAAESALPVTRACMANLVIFCRNSREEAAIAAEIPLVVAQHPARVLLLMADTAHPGAELEAFVSAHCRLLEEGRQICSEHITMRTGAGGLRRLPSAVRSLLLGDLATALWWVPPEAPPVYGTLFEELARLADQIIYDSVAWTDPLHQLMTMASWVGHGQVKSIADLAWRRPKLWRRLIAQSLDPAYAPGALESISEVVIEHGPHALTQAWLLVGWLALRLGWQPQGGKVAPGPEVHWQFTWPHGVPRVRIRRLASGEAEIQTLRVRTQVAGQPVTFHFRAETPSRVSVFAEGFADRMLTLTGPVQSRTEMVARQLSDLVPDRLFEESMLLARTMAEAMR